MANSIKVKRSATPSAAPTTANLELGELAINTYDGKLFIKKDDGTASIVEVGANSGAALSNDTATATPLYPIFAAATTGTPSTVYTSNANYLYTPSVGALQAREMEASNGLFVNSLTINSPYPIPVGHSAQSIGPITIAGGGSVTIPDGSRWIIF